MAGYHCIPPLTPPDSDTPVCSIWSEPMPVWQCEGCGRWWGWSWPGQGTSLDQRVWMPLLEEFSGHSLDELPAIWDKMEAARNSPEAKRQRATRILEMREQELLLFEEDIVRKRQGILDKIEDAKTSLEALEEPE